MQEQNYANHRQFVPLYHFVLTAFVAVALAGSVFYLFRTFSRGSARTAAGLIFLLVIISLISGGLARIFALKAQDRAIRAEENLRHFVLHGSLLDPRLKMRQIVGLRFASDGELGDLARRAAEEGLSENQIKKAIQNWRPDTYRV